MDRVAFIGLSTLLTAIVFFVLSLGSFDAALGALLILIAVIIDLVRCVLRNLVKASSPDVAAVKHTEKRFVNVGLGVAAITGPPVIFWIVIAPHSFVDTAALLSGVRWEWISYDYAGPILARFPVFGRFAEEVANDRQGVLALKLGFVFFIFRALLACYLVPLLAAAIFRGEGRGTPLQSMGGIYLVLGLIALATLPLWVAAVSSTFLPRRFVYVFTMLDVAMIAAICHVAARAEASRIHR